MSSIEAEKTNITCPRCAREFGGLLPPYEVMNRRRYTTLVATHEKPQVCPKCGQSIIMIVSGIQIAFSPQPVEDDARIIEPSGEQVASVIG